MGSKRFQLNQNDVVHILKVLAYSASSAVIGGLIVLVPMFDVPPNQAALAAIIIPILNTALVAVKRYFEDRSNLLE